MFINDIIKDNKYNFLRTNKDLSGNIMFLTFGGSYAYGTYNNNSDIDIRGCMNTPVDVLLGMRELEQYVDDNTDTVIYTFNKLCKLLCSCNPNTIELLGCRPGSYTMVSKAGKMLLDNKKLFLSKRAVGSFGGYANQQLRRLENALVHRDDYPQDLAAKHVINSMEFSKRGLANELFDDSNIIKLHAELVKNPDTGEEVYDFQLDADLRNCSIPELYKATGHLANVIKMYNKNGHRNKKKDYNHLCKHMMHLVRLYHMVFDILEKEEIVTYRESDHDFLMDIRNGKYLADGQMTEEFRLYLTTLDDRLKYDAENSSLPEYPDYNKVNDLMIEINKEAICQ